MYNILLFSWSIYGKINKSNSWLSAVFEEDIYEKAFIIMVMYSYGFECGGYGTIVSVSGSER